MTREHSPSRPGHPRPDGRYSRTGLEEEVVIPPSRRVEWPSERPTARSEPYEPERTPPPVTRERPVSVAPGGRGLPAWLVALGVIIGPGGATALVQVLRSDPAVEIAPRLDAIEKRLGSIEAEQRESAKVIGRLETKDAAEEAAWRARVTAAASHLEASQEPAARAALRELER